MKRHWYRPFRSFLLVVVIKGDVTCVNPECHGFGEKHNPSFVQVGVVLVLVEPELLIYS
jgi:hypothetical protein